MSNVKCCLSSFNRVPSGPRAAVACTLDLPIPRGPLGTRLNQRPIATCATSLFAIIAVFAFSTVFARAADVVEFLSGAKAEGKVLEIRKEDKQFDFETEISGRKFKRTYEFSKVHAVTLNGTRYELTPKTDAPARPTTQPADGEPVDTGEESGFRSRMEIDRLIQQVGETPPDWFDSTPLNFPQTLDLSWPEPPPQGWNNQKNVGQYVWDVINPNPNKWREGTRFMHHLLSVTSDPGTKLRVMNELGRFYHDLLEDYPRAAYWWRQAGVEKGSSFGRSGPHLAQCYNRMGSPQMALELLDKLAQSSDGNILLNVVKVWGDMGQIRKVEAAFKRFRPAQGSTFGHVWMTVGDAYRTVGQYQKAIELYSLVLAEDDNLKGKVKQNKDRARASIEAIKLFELCDVSKVRDGTYNADSVGYEGPVHVAVAVQDGRIESVRVTKHTEKQFYSALTDTPTKIIKKQGVKGVDATSSATITSEAIINATAKALAQGAN